MSQVSIVNSALIKLGEDLINSLDETNKPARTMKEQYDKKRQELLRQYRWNFAILRLVLAPSSTAPEYGYGYKFLVPNNVLRIEGVYDESEPLYQVNYTGAGIPHKLEGGYILCDENPLYVFAIEDVTDTARFDPLFAELLAWSLAADTALAITNSSSKAKIAFAGYTETARLARSANAREGTPEQVTGETWLDSRLSGGRGPFRAGPIV